MDKQGMHHINELIDMSNAFGSVCRERMVQATRELHEKEDHELAEERAGTRSS